MRVFTKRDISYVVQAILDLPFRTRPGAQIDRPGLPGGQ
jgi:hypothetical protein